MLKPAGETPGAATPAPTSPHCPDVAALRGALLPLFVRDALARLDRVVDLLQAAVASPAARGRLSAELAHEAHTLRGAALCAGLDVAAALATDLEKSVSLLGADGHLAQAHEHAEALAALLADLPADGADVRRTGRSDASSTRTVLVVEDFEPNLALLEELLSDGSGLRVLTAATGRDAITLAARHRPDLVLLDRWLPDVSGETVLAELKTDPRTSSIPVIVLSADTCPETVARLREAGAADYVAKPFDLWQLRDTVEAALAEPRRR